MALLQAALNGPEALRRASDRPEVESLLQQGWLNHDKSINWGKIDCDGARAADGTCACRPSKRPRQVW